MRTATKTVNLDTGQIDNSGYFRTEMPLRQYIALLKKEVLTK